MNAKEAARQLKVSLNTVYRLCQEGKLKHRRVGLASKTIRLEQSDVDDYKERTKARPMDWHEEEKHLKHVGVVRLIERVQNRDGAS